MKDTVDIEVGGHTLKISNLDKVLWPATGFTKAQMIDYYTRIAPAMLPHLKGYPVTLKRYPDGVDSEYFYEKECPAYHPEWVSTATMPSRNVRQRVNFCVVDNTSTLVWLANLATIELHTLLAKSKDLDTPTSIAFDLDPGPPAGVLDSAWAAERLRDLLAEMGIEAFPKVSGSKGIHVYVPLNTPATYDKTKSFAKALALMMESRYPKRVTSVMRKDLRAGKVFVDWSQNDPHKTTVCAYSLRAREKPFVSAPVTWDELEEARRRKSVAALSFEAWEVLQRVKDHGDIFTPVLKKKQRLPST
ncbi:MAG: non-homologous end-joining DNA ligase [Candidatus Geothermincolia bacterium]